MLGHFFPLRKVARICQLRQLAVGLAAAAFCGGLLTQAEAAGSGVSPTTWGGLNWGIGIATDFDVGGARVGSATVVNNGVNNIVRVTDTSSNVGISFVLESHYFFAGPAEMGRILGVFEPPGQCPVVRARDPNCTEWAHGPFVAIEVGGGATAPTTNTTGPITAYALGWMVGFHHPKYDATSGALVPDSTSWNIGVGLRVDPKAQVLGDGIVANQPLPVGESTSPVRTKTEPRPGVMLMSSFSF
jgi:hypothetical protein